MRWSRKRCREKVCSFYCVEHMRGDVEAGVLSSSPIAEFWLVGTKDRDLSVVTPHRVDRGSFSPPVLTPNVTQ